MANPNEPAADWIDQTVEERLRACQVMLRVHGFTTDHENTLVRARIDRWYTRWFLGRHKHAAKAGG